MALYWLDTSTPGATITSLKQGLTAAGILTTNFSESLTSTGYLVFNCPRSNKVIRFQASTATFDVSIGDAWTSGSTITNSKYIASAPGSAATLSSGAIIVTSSLLAFALRGIDGNVYTAIFTTFVNGNNVALGFTSSVSSSMAAACYDTTAGISILPVQSFNLPIQAADNSYFMTDIYMKNISTSVLINSMVVGVKFILRSRDTSVPFLTYGNDVVLNAGNQTGPTNLTNASFIITNGLL